MRRAARRVRSPHLIPSHEPDGRASLSAASGVGRVPSAWSGSPGRTRPTGDRFMGRVRGFETEGASHEPTAVTRPSSHPMGRGCP
ncbi:MAG: hypothetical protein FJ398_00645 [Verrucomicrobia bacterium]|nr:hypothetical protein [Verrucomicrobiota bacterium]